MKRREAIETSTDILVVDDDPDISQALRDFLEHEGYHVDLAGTGNDAVERCKRQQYGAVILDLGLPDMDGLLVLKKLQEHDAKLPVIILTAFTASERTAGVLSHGAFALLTKPYNREQLKGTLGRAIGVKALTAKVETIESALSASEHRFRSVVQSASDAIVLADHTGHIVFWNPAAERLFQYREQEVLGQPLTTIMPARYREEHERGIERLRTTGRARILGKTVELTGLRKDGTEVPIELSLAAWQADREQFYCGIIRDITERKQAETIQAEHLRLATFVAEVSSVVSKSGTLDDMLRGCTEAIVRHLEAALARIWLFNESERVLELRASAGLSTHLDGPHGRIPLGALKIGRIALGRRPYLTNDFADDPSVSDPEWARREGIIAFAGYPLVVENRLMGVVALFARRQLTEMALTSLASAADAMALGIDRLQTQESFRRLSRYNELILDSAGEGIYGLDRRGQTTFINQAAAQMLQWTPAELMGRSMHGVVHHSRADGTSYPAEECPIYAALRDGSIRAVDSEVFWRKDGTSFPVEYVSTPMREHGDLVGAVVVFKDITERKRTEAALRESEERFRQVTEHIRDVFWMSDTDKRRMLYVSPGYEDLWGRSCASLYASPLSWLEAIHPDDRERVREAAVTKQIAGQYVEEYRIVRPDGTVRWIRDRAFPIRDPSGAVYRIAGIAQDITELKPMGHVSMRG
ncbi:PAS domain S-box protein [Candidatus Nitrospira bockiana]